ncbi:MAG: cobalt-precorrin-5B (C(1))-methyltransferase [Desulfovibrionaceae bacterium]|nr:cobalt-precorrin-5B (C(1))-methyltransferase [Desulfovibrionaceae bacterium]
MAKRGARQGFTTGSAAAAAAKAAIWRLLTGEALDTIDIPLPAGGRLGIPIAGYELFGDAQARASVLKDGGDDPDATHGARVMCRARLCHGADGERVEIAGGTGVGRVTLPGLAVAPGQAAINPDPLRQIREAAAEAMDAAGYFGPLLLTVEVEDGERIAQKTLNARLGIVGGISILGTTGIVKPFSHSAWKATIKGGLDVARATGLREIALTTGRKSERFLRRELPGLPDQSYVQAADYFAFSLAQAAKRDFSRIAIGCFFGKLVKMALGYAYTHAKSGPVDFAVLAGWLDEAGATAETIAGCLGAITARRVLELLENDPARPKALAGLVAKAQAQARLHAGCSPALALYVFDFDGRLLRRDSLASAARPDY